MDNEPLESGLHTELGVFLERRSVTTDKKGFRGPSELSPAQGVKDVAAYVQRLVE